MSYPGNDEAQLRARQIDTLRQYFSTVKEVQKDSVYEIPLPLPNRKTITLTVSLPKEFPRFGPTLQIHPPVQHAAIDSQSMCVLPSMHDSLARWSVHNNLGKTVFEVVQRLMREPPVLITQSSNPLSTSNPSLPTSSPNPAPASQPPRASVNTAVNQGSLPPPSYSSSAQTHTPLPVVPSAFPELVSKSPSELSQLLNDEAEFTSFFESLPSIQTIRVVRDDIKKSHDETLKRLAAKEAILERLRRDAQVRQQGQAEKKKELDRYLAKQNEVMKQFSTASLIEKLGEASSHAEADSDQCASKFLVGNIELKEFLKEFSEKRRTYHLRAAKKESLTMLAR